MSAMFKPGDWVRIKKDQGTLGPILNKDLCNKQQAGERIKIKNANNIFVDLHLPELGTYSSGWYAERFEIDRTKRIYKFL